MSLIQDVTDTVNEMGRATVDDLLPHFPTYTRKQVHRAVNQASYIRAIKLVERGASGGKNGGGEPCVYGPPGAPVEMRLDDDEPLPTRTCVRGDYGIPRVASVWELAGAMA